MSMVQHLIPHTLFLREGVEPKQDKKEAQSRCLCPVSLLFFLPWFYFSQIFLCVCVCVCVCVCGISFLEWVELQNFNYHLKPHCFISCCVFNVFPSLSLAIMLLVFGVLMLFRSDQSCFSFLICLLHSLNTRLRINVLYLLYFWINKGALVGESFCNDGYLIVTVDEAWHFLMYW